MRKTIPRCPDCFSCDADKILPVPGHGPRDARVLVVAEQPGAQENAMGIPLVGKTGDEYNKVYLPLAGLSRSEVYSTNACKCKWADAKDAPPQHVVESCANFHLKRELEMVNPEVVVLMGGVSNSLLHLGRDIDTIHGTGRYAELLGGWYKIFSTYHPARGMHQTSAMTSLLIDFEKLRYFISGELGYVSDDFPNPGFYRITDPDTLDMILDQQWYLTHLAIDTESKKIWNGYHATIRYIPWSIQFAIGPTDGYFIRLEDEEVVDRFATNAKRFRKVVMHNAQHDMDILHQCGVDLDWGRVQDTMMLAYHDARLPKGLKALSYQLAGIEMRNFDDVVIPYGRKAALAYLRRAAAMEWSKPVQEPTGEVETKKCKDCDGKGVMGVGRGKMRRYYECSCDAGYVTGPKMTRKQGIGQKISRMLTDAGKNPDIDPWERWENWESAVQELIDRLGPMPLASVELVPEGEILAYAGSDATATWRVYPILIQRLTQLRRSFNGKNLNNQTAH